MLHSIKMFWSNFFLLEKSLEFFFGKMSKTGPEPRSVLVGHRSRQRRQRRRRRQRQHRHRRHRQHRRHCCRRRCRRQASKVSN